MRIKYAVILLLLLLTACSGTRIVRYDSPAYQQQPEVPLIEPTAEPAKVGQDVVQNTPSVEENDPDITTSGSSRSGSSKTTSTTTNTNTVASPGDSSTEYNIIGCCNEGRLSIQTKKERIGYTEANIRDILIMSYRTHCDLLKEYSAQRVYLRHANDIQDSSYLTFFKDINYKKVQVDYKEISESFEGCT